jgi:hypothetical protein
MPWAKRISDLPNLVRVTSQESKLRRSHADELEKNFEEIVRARAKRHPGE